VDEEDEEGQRPAAANGAELLQNAAGGRQAKPAAAPVAAPVAAVSGGQVGLEQFRAGPDCYSPH
jgi:hypothetical protein